jgi:hypothetical protein
VLMRTRSIFIIGLSILVLLGMVGCSPAGKTPDPTATSNSPEVPSPEVPTDAPTGETQLAESPTEEEETLQLGSSIFIQEEENLTTAFVLENLDTNLTYYNIEYTILAYDVGGATISTDTGPIDFILPGQTVGAVSQILLDEGVAVDKVDVEWVYSTEENSDYKSPFTISNTRYFDAPDFDVFTGLIANASAVTYTDLRINAIALDEDGRLVGGGIGYVSILPGKDQVGVNVYGTVTEAPAAVVFYPTKSIYSACYEDGDWRNNLKVMDFGFIQDDIQVGGGFLVKNVTDRIIENSRYVLTIYEADGTISNVSSGTIDLIWPGETLGVSPDAIPLLSGASPDKVDVIVLPGDFVEHELSANPLIANDVTYAIDNDLPKVTVKIVNMLDRRITDIYIYVLLFDEKGEIVGGGAAYPENIEASGSVGVEVGVTYVGDTPPARVEAYPCLTTWSELGD